MFGCQDSGCGGRGRARFEWNHAGNGAGASTIVFVRPAGARWTSRARPLFRAAYVCCLRADEFAPCLIFLVCICPNGPLNGLDPRNRRGTFQNSQCYCEKFTCTVGVIGGTVADSKDSSMELFDSKPYLRVTVLALLATRSGMVPTTCPVPANPPYKYNLSPQALPNAPWSSTI